MLPGWGVRGGGSQVGVSLRFGLPRGAVAVGGAG